MPIRVLRGSIVYLPLETVESPPDTTAQERAQVAKCPPPTLNPPDWIGGYVTARLIDYLRDQLREERKGPPWT